MSALASGVESVLTRSFEDLSLLAEAQYCTVDDPDFQFYVKREFGATYAKKLIKWAES